MNRTADHHQILVSHLSDYLAQQPGVDQVEQIQTHISTVLLAGDHAYKVKKPLDLGFLDFSTLERRKFCSEEELRLNGRLAPQIYQAVVAITGSVEEPEIDGKGEVVDYAVKMRRFSQEGLLSNQMEAISQDTALSIASRLADFHQTIEVAPAESEFGSPEVAVFPMRQNFEQIRGLVDNPEALERMAVVEAWTEQSYQALEPLLAERKRTGFIRECHGDLHMGNIALVDDQVVIFDGIEFNPDLSWIDTMNELAFLLMDLDERGRAELSSSVLNQYLESSGDYAGLPLLRFYQVYRAMVRAKIAVIRLAQPDLAEAEKRQVYDAFFGYLSRAEAYTRASAKGVILTFGPSGAGKSTVTNELIQQLPAVRIRSDVERKRLAGLLAGDSSDSDLNGGIYTAVFSAKTYDHLIQLADIINQSGFIAVVDATFLKQAQRQPFSVFAEQANLPFIMLDFQVPEAELRRRVEQRMAVGGDPSEADVAVLEGQLAALEALDDSESRYAVVVNQAGEFSLQAITALLG